MTIIEAINKIDELKPNQYEQSDKVKWLSVLDGMVKNEIIDTHEGGANITFSGYNDDTSEETVLLIPFPYDDIYIKWLEAQIDYANAETVRYNNSITMYNTAISAYMNRYHREHMPLNKNKIKYW